MGTYATIRAVEYYLPSATLTNDDLVKHFPKWTAEAIVAKTGIISRHIAAGDELASDLAVEAARKLFASGVCQPSDIDFVLVCTQSPDYLIPTTACLIQNRLGIPNTAGALDFNLGCSGFVYGLSLAKGLIETGEAQNVLLLTCETYSKHIHPNDFNVRSIFGDGAAATLVQAYSCGKRDSRSFIGPFVFGTDGSGEAALIVRQGSLRERHLAEHQAISDTSDNCNNLFMNGPEVFSFTLRAVPESVNRLLARAGIGIEDVDLYIFHQANRFMLEHLRQKLQIPSEKFIYAMEDSGNTVSATIPIALHRAIEQGRVNTGSRLMFVGFGVGYSWCASLIEWTQ
jgi:3-oxoacyl-[acyl-carrier-protein] synthase-3